MEYKAIVSFSGLNFSMRAGEVRVISDASLADDLANAGYIIPLEEDAPKATAQKKEAPKKTSTKGKGKAKNEN